MPTRHTSIEMNWPLYFELQLLLPEWLTAFSIFTNNFFAESFCCFAYAWSLRALAFLYAPETVRGINANSTHFYCNELTSLFWTAPAAPNVPTISASSPPLCTHITFQTELRTETYKTSPASWLETREELLPHLWERPGSHKVSSAIVIQNEQIFNAYRCIQMHTDARRRIRTSSSLSSPLLLFVGSGGLVGLLSPRVFYWLRSTFYLL